MPTKTEGWNTANVILLLCETSANEVGSENRAVSTFESIQNQPSCACCMLGCKAAALMLAGVGCCALRLQQQQQQSWYSGATSQPFSHSPCLSLSHARTHTCSLSLSSVTLVTYFLHGNSISCCAHREKERRKKNATWSDWNVCVCVCNCGFKLGDLTYSSDEIELLLFCMSYHQIDCVIEQWTS